MLGEFVQILLTRQLGAISYGRSAYFTYLFAVTKQPTTLCAVQLRGYFQTSMFGNELNHVYC
jgi:hypothetical protein